MNRPSKPEDETARLTPSQPVIRLDRTRSLQLSETQESDAELEKRVKERTRDLSKTNRALRREIAEAKRAEETARRVNGLLERRVQRLDALHQVDRTLHASLDLKLNLEFILDQVRGRLGVDAVDVLMSDSQTQSLEFAAGKGFITGAPAPYSLRLHCGPASRAMTQCKRVAVAKLAGETTGLPSEWVADEGFVSYLCVPLIAKGQVHGVMELFQRGVLEPEGEWLEFLEALAGQAAVAVENANLLNRLQHTNRELTRAYDATLEGWSLALDLRDKETEGHTKRVTEMTVRLARAMGVDEAELVHIRRGALLHDIGKMGVSDDILFKPGPLTPEEWDNMRLHPVHSYNMLSPIDFLRPALDIPYCHHEKWDGTGYPRGLSKEQIPLAARIFAVVDVWDGLRSNRPYRPGWPEDRVRRHIRSMAGTHFDPKVAETFLQLLATSITSDHVPNLDIYNTWAPSSVETADEAARLQALRSYGVLESSAEPNLDQLAKLAAQLCGASMAGIALVDANRQWFRARHGFDLTEAPRNGSLCAHTSLQTETLVVVDIVQDGRFSSCPLVTALPEVRFFAGTPLITPDGLAMGALFVMDAQPRDLKPGEKEALETLGRQVMALLELRRLSVEGPAKQAASEAIDPQVSEQLRLAREYSIELEQQQQQLLQTNARLAELVTSDNLTGLKNQGYFREVLESSFSFSMRRGLPLSVVMLDVDHFKSYNDTFGHPAGDDVLRQVAHLLNESARAEDLAARYGGEEFVVLLPATDSQGAIEVAERMREAIEAHAWPRRGVTVSLGVATICPSILYASSLVEEADRALYRSKAQGRNRVTHSRDLLEKAA